ncbi:MAG: hypothetical protein P4L83_16190, partial [Nevskia sp.]|nr:hypothetical protein [Nevskia sp.]
MAPPLVYDLLRLFCAASAHATSGLVRLDLACASHFFANWPGECLGLLCTPWGTRLFGRARVLRGLHQLESVWHEQSEAQDAPALAGLCARLHSPAPPPARHARLPGLGHGRLLAATGFVPGSSRRATPPGSLWVSVARPAPAPDPWLRPVL